MKDVRTLNQERARFALEEVRRIKHSNDKEKFKAGARQLPSIIVSNGLIPALAFYKSKDERKEVYKVLNKWLKDRKIVKEDALDELVKEDFVYLRIATSEALAFADWLKRMAEVELDEDKS